MNKKKILVLGASTKAGMYVTRQFHRMGYHTTIADWKNLPVKYSRFVDRYLSFCSPEIDLAEFERALLTDIAQEKYDCILPLNDVTIEVAYRIQEKIPAGTKLMGLNPPEVYRYAHSKWELIRLAREVGISTPHSLFIDSLETLEKNSAGIGFPCVVKPPCSALIQDNKIINFTVRFAKNKHELTDIVREQINNTALIIQEMVPGFGIGYNVIANKGEVLNEYIHKRINENKGISSFREALGTEEFGLQQGVRKLIEKINWTGVAMVEFKVHDNKAVLMEMNGRFYGSLELAVKCGLNYPQQFLDMELNGKLPAKYIAFRKGVKVRNLHDETLLYWAQLFKGRLGIFLKWNLSVLKTIFSRNEYIEDNFFEDPGFVAGLYWSDIQRMYRKTSRKLKLRFGRVKRRVLVLPATQTLDIAFICKGNICRSPFAAAYATLKKTGHRYHSFGTFQISQRMSPLNALAAAGKHNIDLGNFRSATLKKEQVDAMDYLVVMDKKNYFDLLEAGVPEKKIYFLAATDIADPYSQNAEYFTYIYQKIADAIDAL